MKRIPVLLVDDEENIRVQMAAFLRSNHYQVEVAQNGVEALQLQQERPCRIALLDYRMPDMDGLTLARRLLEQHPQLVVLMMTAYGAVDTAVEAIKAGLHEFLLKPVRAEQLLAKLEFISEKLRAEDELAHIRRWVHGRERLGSLVGGSQVMQKVFASLRAAAESELPVLIVGDTGTGKELAARAIHDASPRHREPFVPVHCGAVPETLAESELFGHARGAFTGADRERPGKLAAAQGGTLFLDELATAPLGFQIKLLRVLEEKRFSPVGADEQRDADVRVITATNIDPELAVARGELRKDLFYRLNVLRVDLPPLQDRPEDIPLLVQELIHRSARERGGISPRPSPAFLDALMQWSWPGNVRQLHNVVQAALASGAEVLEVHHIPARLRPGPAAQGADDTIPGPPAAPSPVAAVADPPGQSLQAVVQAAEREHIEQVLRHTAGRVAPAAQLLGITERGLRRKLSRLGIKKERFVPGD